MWGEKKTEKHDGKGELNIFYFCLQFKAFVSTYTVFSLSLHQAVSLFVDFVK